MKSSSLRTPLMCLGLLALAACGGKKEQGPPQAPPPEVGVVKAQPKTVPLTKDLVGRLSSYRSADVRARVPGVLLQRTYEEGSDVKKGQVLFKIDPAPLRAVLAANQGSLAQAEATYTNAKISAQRARDLAPKGYISKADLDNAEAQERTAKAAVAAARANVESAKINLGFTDVVSPIDGRAGQQQVTEGALVGQGDVTLLTTVDQIDPLYVNFTIGVTELDAIRRSATAGGITLAEPNTAKVQITLPDGTRYSDDGTLDFSSATADPATGSVNLRARIPNAKHSLLPGMYVTVKANLGEQHGVFEVPQAAVQRDTAGSFVLVVGADGKVVRKDVQAGSLVGSTWLITDGLKAGDDVIVSGIQKVKEGAPAKASPWTPNQPAPGAQPQAAQPAAAGKAAHQP
ncbi:MULTISPECIES: efflux RND transporter periplasmic adaptor subunit [Dyella]|uniref:Efflux RND transporter periplasmic adaptor subunit n=2 Tax=Dyella TaxID=231454 RepID=A0A4R0YTI9_9GAMM|nr:MULTISPECIES: efflux RND transporter periplasmic adaptor subunit [Dyella]TBR39723.1 efflux RND transporter periplasmic adaptor subunit [Dyella terrae]TCI12695.1 efflux RND transporter periplasmic adaptor subunit [Dyella soli]